MSVSIDVDLLREVEQFLYREARLADEHAYDAWEALWTDDGVYWVPANGDATDPMREMSVIFDNRSRIGLRVRQYHTGKRHSQIPVSRLRRMVTNIELLDPVAGFEDDIHVGANFVAYESRERGMTTWAGRYDYRLRQTGDGLRLAAKTVRLIDNDRPINTLAFLI